VVEKRDLRLAVEIAAPLTRAGLRGGGGKSFQSIDRLDVTSDAYFSKIDKQK
jgi:hypothetical protein